MIPTPDFTLTVSAMAEKAHHILTQQLHRREQTGEGPGSSTGEGLSGFMRLAPETRNAIYGMVFESPLPFFIVAADGPSPRFRLRERSDTLQYEAIAALQALGLGSRSMRHEARTFFYASKHFLVLPYGYEYLLVFVHWLDSIGPDCRAVLQTLCLAGYMWYVPSLALTQRLHDMLRTCVSLRTLVVQLSIWHLCEAQREELEGYLSFEGPEPHDGPMPVVDMTPWAQTIVAMPEIQTMRLDIIMSIDRARENIGRTREYIYFMDERGRALASDLERRLLEELAALGGRADVVVTVTFVGTNERVYHGQPW